MPCAHGFGALFLGSLLLASMSGCHSKPAEIPAAEQSVPNEVTVTPGIAENLKIGQPEMHGISGELEVPARVETVCAGLLESARRSPAASFAWTPLKDKACALAVCLLCCTATICLPRSLHS